MRRRVLILFVAAVVLVTQSAPRAQVRTPSPEVTASQATWQLNSEPIVVNGLIYNATREVRMFDGDVMAQIDVYQRVPIYADTTLEPFTIVYVPIGLNRMRTYERVRFAEMAGPSGRGATPVTVTPGGIVVAAGAPQPVGTSGAIETAPLRTESGSPTRSGRTIVESIPPPRTNRGIWIDFNGAQYYSSGAAVPYIPGRFVRVGDYRGFAVYRDRAGDPNVVWVTVVDGGPLAPYTRR